MKVFKITNSNIKHFMNKLLKENTFDLFETRGVEIRSFTKFEISGVIYNENKEEVIKNNFCKWDTLKTYVFNIIKGNKRPKSIKIIFSIPDDDVSTIHQNASALFLNILFESDEVTLTTATSQKNFSLEKSVDSVWNDYVTNFLSQNQIFADVVE